MITAVTEVLAVRDGKRSTFVDVRDIEVIQSAANYVRIHTAAHTFVYRIPISALIETLDPATFIRVHRSTIINIGHLESKMPRFGVERMVRMKSGRRVKLSRTYRAEFEARLRA